MKKLNLGGWDKSHRPSSYWASFGPGRKEGLSSPPFHQKGDGPKLSSSQAGRRSLTWALVGALSLGLLGLPLTGCQSKQTNGPGQSASGQNSPDQDVSSQNSPDDQAKASAEDSSKGASAETEETKDSQGTQETKADNAKGTPNTQKTKDPQDPKESTETKEDPMPKDIIQAIGQDLPFQAPHSLDGTWEAVKKLDQASLSFAIKLMEANGGLTADSEASPYAGNFVYSPISSWMCFELLRQGMEGDTAALLDKVLLHQGLSNEEAQKLTPALLATVEAAQFLPKEPSYEWDDSELEPTTGTSFGQDPTSASSAADSFPPTSEDEPFGPTNIPGVVDDPGSFSTGAPTQWVPMGEEASSAASTQESSASPTETAKAEAEAEGEKEEMVQVAELKLLNSVLATKKFHLEPAYQKAVRAYFNARLLQADFGKNEAIADYLNTYVTRETKGMIGNIFNKDFFSEETVLTLMNLVYFKGTWEEPFEKERTVDEDFYGKKATVKVPMMQQDGRYSYMEDDKAQYLALPYKGHSRMVLMLPKDKKADVRTLAKDFFMDQENRLYGLESREGSVKLPRFKVESSFDFMEQISGQKNLDGLNLSALPQKDFAPLFKEKDLPIALTKAFQVAAIQADEEGTEAAAVTTILEAMTALPPAEEPFEFVCDHPFLYKIENQGVTSFVGAVTDF